MMKKPKIKISLIDQKGHMGCHRGHQIGDTFDFDTELPSQPDGSIVFCCPDVDVINVFKIEVVEEKD